MPTDDRTISVGRRVVSLLGVVALFSGLAVWWSTVVTVSAAAAAVLSAGFVVVLGMAMAVLLARGLGVLERLDRVVLGLGVLFVAVESWTFVRPGFDGNNDEYFLGAGALHTLLRHHDPYQAIYGSVATHEGLTPLLGGGAVTHYEYPPLTLELGWVLAHVWHPLGEPQVIMMLGVLASVVIVFCALPRDYRPLALALLLGLAAYTAYANGAMPAMLALPLLCWGSFGWTAIGADGRFTARQFGQCVAFGLAATAQQLSWIFLAFALVALWRIRRGELDRRGTARVMVAVVGLVLLVFAVLNAPFAALGPHAWTVAMLSVFTQHVWPYGVGLVSVITTITGHSGALQFLGYGTALLLLTLLVLTAVGIRRVALLVPLLVTATFLLAARSTADYFQVFVPVWFVWAATADSAMIAAARPLGGTRWLARPRIAVSALVAAILVSVAVASVAVASPAPMALTVTGVRLDTNHLLSVSLRVRNRTHRWLRPSFVVGLRGRAGTVWTIVGGRVDLPGGASSDLTVVPLLGSFPVAAQLYVYGLADDPASISSIRLEVRADQITVVGASDPETEPQRACAISVLAGGSGADCSLVG